MSNKKKTKGISSRSAQRVTKEEESKTNNSLIFGGVLLAMTSIGLLIFVLSEKVFHLS